MSRGEETVSVLESQLVSKGLLTLDEIKELVVIETALHKSSWALLSKEQKIRFDELHCINERRLPRDLAKELATLKQMDYPRSPEISKRHRELELICSGMDPKKAKELADLGAKLGANEPLTPEEECKHTELLAIADSFRPDLEGYN